MQTLPLKVTSQPSTLTHLRASSPPAAAPPGEKSRRTWDHASWCFDVVARVTLMLLMLLVLLVLPSPSASGKTRVGVVRKACTM
jgi:hypothetical protein